MKTSRKLQIIVIGSAAIVLLASLRVGQLRRSAGPEGNVTSPPGTIYMKDTNLAHTWTTNPPSNVFRQFNHHPVQPMPKDEVPEPVTVTYNITSERAHQMWEIMADKLAEYPPIEADDQTIQQLVRARTRIAYMSFGDAPASWKESPDFGPMEAFRLKHLIADLLPNATNTLIMQRVLEANIGVKTPPMVDFELRDRMEDEIEAARAK